MLKIGFIGFGKSANRYHMPFIDLLKDQYEMIGFYTKGDQKFSMEYPTPKGFKGFETIEELFDNVDIVTINTPSKFHYEYTKQALLAGKNVICEKPITNNLDELYELYEIANEKGLFLSPYQNRRFDSDFLSMQKAMKEHDFGKLVEIETIHSQFRSDAVYSKGTKYDGAVMGHAVHFVDQIVSLFGEPEDIKYDIYNQGWSALSGETPDLDDYYDIKMIYDNFRVRVKFTRVAAKEQPRWILNGTKGTIERYSIDTQESFLKNKKFPKDTPEFGKDEGIKTFYYEILESTEDQPLLRTHEIESEYEGYQEFYKRVHDSIVSGKDRLVTEHQAKVVINILTTIVEDRKYEKIK